MRLLQTEYVNMLRARLYKKEAGDEHARGYLRNCAN